MKIEVRKMIIYRWQSPVIPEKDQMRLFFEREGLPPIQEVYEPGEEVAKHQHPFDEVRMVCSGQIIFNISGNQLLLRSGDRIVIPSNTWHSKKVQGDQPCVSLCAFTSY